MPQRRPISHSARGHCGAHTALMTAHPLRALTPAPIAAFGPNRAGRGPLHAVWRDAVNHMAARYGSDADPSRRRGRHRCAAHVRRTVCIAELAHPGPVRERFCPCGSPFATETGVEVGGPGIAAQLRLGRVEVEAGGRAAACSRSAAAGLLSFCRASLTQGRGCAPVGCRGWNRIAGSVVSLVKWKAQGGCLKVLPGGGYRIDSLRVTWTGQTSTRSWKTPNFRPARLGGAGACGVIYVRVPKRHFSIVPGQPCSHGCKLAGG